MKQQLTFPNTSFNNHFSNVFLAKIFSNLLFHFGSRKRADEIFIKLLEQYSVNKKMIDNPSLGIFNIKSLIKNIDKIDGLVVATSHYGIFAYVPFLIAEYFQKTVTTIVLGNGDFYINEIKPHLDLSNKKYDIDIIELSSKVNLFKVIKLLKSGQIVVIYADANYSQNKKAEKYVNCNFLGRQIKAKPGFCQLSSLASVPTVFAFMTKEKKGFTLNISEPIDMPTKKKQIVIKILFKIITPN